MASYKVTVRCPGCSGRTIVPIESFARRPQIKHMCPACKTQFALDRDAFPGALAQVRPGTLPHDGR